MFDLSNFLLQLEELLTMESAESVVTPWEVTGSVDYMKIVSQWGSQLIDKKLIDRLEHLTGKPAHPWIKRGVSL
jgi:tryptophanyl-tRNA synthetase